MPEQQKPFITRGGKLSTLGVEPPAELLAPIALSGQIAELRREQELRGSLYPGWVENKRLEEPRAHEQLRLLERAIQSLGILQEPQVNAAVMAMKSFSTADSTLVSDVIVALITVGTRRPRLMLALRSALESVS
jgi:hypothetical protein